MDLAATLRRVQRLLLSPGTEWNAVAAEPAQTLWIYVTYAIPLIAASALATAIGMAAIGTSLPLGETFRFPPASALSHAAVWAGLNVVAIYALSLAINALAPLFGSPRDAGQAFKLAAYTPTAAWIASLLTIVPALNILASVAGLYSLYLLFLGLPKLMKPAEEKAIAYTIAVGMLMLVMAFAIASIANSMLPSMTPVYRVN